MSKCFLEKIKLENNKNKYISTKIILSFECNI